MIVQLRQRPTATGPSFRNIVAIRIRELWGRMLNRCRIPGAINETHIHDALTGQEISISVSPLFTKLTVNGRDYFFHRMSGRFDGTGMGCSQ